MGYRQTVHVNDTEKYGHLLTNISVKPLFKITSSLLSPSQLRLKRIRVTPCPFHPKGIPVDRKKKT